LSAALLSKIERGLLFPTLPTLLRVAMVLGVGLAIEGTLSVRVDETDHMLAPGDSMYFDSSVTHTYRRSGGHRCRAIVVTGA
jgi:transcriptional regulator with XRE-family HTH domain